MGKGKGAPEYWVAVVKPGRVMFEIAGVPEETAREALRLAMNKLPNKTKFVARETEKVGENEENGRQQNPFLGLVAELRKPVSGIVGLRRSVVRICQQNNTAPTGGKVAPALCPHIFRDAVAEGDAFGPYARNDYKRIVHAGQKRRREFSQSCRFICHLKSFVLHTVALQELR